MNDSARSARKTSAARPSRWTAAHLVLLGVAQLSVGVAPFAPLWATGATALGLLLLVGAAGSLARLELHGTSVTRGPRGATGVALVFDVPTAAIRPLLGELERRGVHAAFAVTATGCARDPSLIGAILAAGHELVASTRDGTTLLPWSTPRHVQAQVLSTFRALERLGPPFPRAFLPPRGLTHPSVRGALLTVGAFLLAPRRTWSGRGGTRAAPGDLLRLTSADHEAVAALLSSLRARGLEPLPLSALLRRPILGDTTAGPVDAFYDGLAATYDAEQALAVAAPVRRAERLEVERRLAALVRPGTRVLELGAGTGRFTERLVALGAEVTAVDLSGEMLARLRDRLGGHAQRQVSIVRGDLLQVDLGDGYDLVCSFSCFEYVADLDPLLTRIVASLAPEGRLFFTTARRSFFRAFVQLGNAVRQGLWLSARGDNEIRAALTRAGLTCEALETHALTWGPGGGMLASVLARRTR